MEQVHRFSSLQQQMLLAASGYNTTPIKQGSLPVAPTSRQQPTDSNCGRPNHGPAVVGPSSTTLPQHRFCLLNRLLHLPLSKRQQHIYVVTHLRRPSLHTPWGVSFTRFDEEHVILGNVKPITTQHMAWANVIFPSEQHLLQPNHILMPQQRLLPSSAAAYANRILENTSVAGRNQRVVQPFLQLLSGDLVLAIDGISCCHFHSLAALTDHMRTSLQMTLLVIRKPQVTVLANKTLLATATLAPILALDLPYQAALVAHRAWQLEVGPSATAIAAAAAGTLPPARLQTRMVTPERMEDDSSSSPSSKKKVVSTKFTSLSQRYPDPPPFLHHVWRNPWFLDKKNGKQLPFADNWEFSPEEGTRAHLFLSNDIADFSSWLQKRKSTWRSQYRVCQHIAGANGVEDEWCDEVEDEMEGRGADFWTSQGDASFNAWLARSKAKWKSQYSWNQAKRKRIYRQVEEEVHLSPEPSPDEFEAWIRIRRNQWRLLRRKNCRKRQRQEKQCDFATSSISNTLSDESNTKNNQVLEEKPKARRQLHFGGTAESTEMEYIDQFLEEEEREQQKQNARPSIDISFLFDASKGAPDDVVFHCLQYLVPKEHLQLLSINKPTSLALKGRNDLWRLLCPSEWVLPRRPRKPWYELYFSKLRMEQKNHRKRWDDLLLKCQAVLAKGDFVQKIEKLINKGEADFGFTVSYISPIVCERNSLLNLAVIHRRHKIVRWLVDTKHADIESYDRGNFTPLLNAAWAGDRQLVRFFLQRGSNRSTIGRGHYSKALAHPDFRGLNAEGWARKKGYNGIADLICLGL